MTNEEKLVQVDENDKVIAARPRGDFENGGFIHRSSYLLLLNPQDEILLQRRPLSKKWHPGKWTFSVTGSVLANETYEDCIKRELKKVLVKEINFEELFKYRHFDDVDKAFKKVFIGKVDTVNLNPATKDSPQYAWIKIKDLEKEIRKQPDKYAPPFLTGIKIALAKKLLAFNV